MSWAPRLKSSFTSRVRDKGASYARNHRVEIESSDDQSLAAVVEGSGGHCYDVRLRWNADDGVAYGSCTCPHYEEGNSCKHIWATIQSADELQLSPALPGAHPLRLLHDDEEEYDVYLDDDDEEYNGYDCWVEVHPANRSSAKRNSQPWHKQLASLGEAPHVPKLDDLLASRQQRVFYVIDVAESAQRDTLTVRFYHQLTKKNGTWGKAKEFTVGRRDLASLDPIDAELLGLVLGNRLGGGYSPYGWAAGDLYSYSQTGLNRSTFELLLPKMAATERFGWFMGHPQSPDEAQPLAWDPGPAWQPRLRIEADDREQQWNVVGELTRDSSDGEAEVLPLSEPVLILSDGIVMRQDSISRLAADCDFRWIELLRQQESLEIPYADRERLLAVLGEQPHGIEVLWPAGHQPQVRAVPPTGCLRVHPAPRHSMRGTRGELYADAHFKYGQQQVAIDSVARQVFDAASDQVLERDRAAELELLGQLRDLKIAPRVKRYYEQDLPGTLQFMPHRLPAIVSALVAAGWDVEAEGHKVRAAGEFRMNVTSGVDWFELETTIDFGQATASLPALLAAARSGEHYVELDDGSRGMLPQEWLERFGPLAELAELSDDRLRFKPSQALLLDAMLAERQGEISLEVDRQFATIRNRLQSFDGVAPAKPPRGFRGELRPYQQQGLGWLKFLEDLSLGGCLADDMGLGKTVQVLALLLYRRQKRSQSLPSLVVVPKSLVLNWQIEAERFAPTLQVLNYTGTDRKQFDQCLGDYNVVVTTYGTLRRDIETLRNQPFDYAVLDEAQAIKNHSSLSAKSCRLLNAKHRLTLTGTPIENRLDELWSQLEFLNPGLLGRSSALQSLAKSAGEKDQQQQDESLRTLRRGLAPFILRRTKEQVLKDLPEKNEQTVYCELLPKDRKQYDQLRAYYRDVLLKRIDDSGLNKSKMHVLEALLRLRQAACHPGLIDKKLATRPSAKVDALVEHLADVTAEGHKALVFSQFTSLLSIVRRRLDELGIVYEYLDGRTRKRQEKVDRFQTDEACSAFLISLKAGGTGLNLTAADYVFLLDPWWNPAVEAQAIDRAHRIGQTRRVFAYRLIARDTVEEKVLQLQQKKRQLADAIIAGSGAVLKGLTVDDLRLLLS